MNQFPLHELVQSPTRVTATTASQLALILTNISGYFQNTTTVPFAGSDHHIVLTHARGVSQTSDHRVVYSRRYSKLDRGKLEDVLLNDSWDKIFHINDINVCTEAFTLVMQYIMDVMVPLKKTRIKRTCSPWSHDVDITIARH